MRHVISVSDSAYSGAIRRRWRVALRQCVHGLRYALLVALIGIVSPVASADGQVVRLVVSDDNAFASETANRLQKLIEQSATGIALERVDIASLPAASSANPANLVVTMGDLAWQAATTLSSQDSAVLAVIPRRHIYQALANRSSRNTSAIFLEQPVNRLLNLVSLLRPQAQVGIVLGTTTQEMVPLLQTAANERNQHLHMETANEETAVGRALGKVIRKIDVLLAIPDPVVQTANTVQPILLMSYNAGVPVIGYSAAYQRAGAMVSLYTTPEQLARQAVEAIIAWRQGKGLPANTRPKYFTVGINTTVAHSLGVELPDADTLEQKLRSMKE